MDQSLTTRDTISGGTLFTKCLNVAAANQWWFDASMNSRNGILLISGIFHHLCLGISRVGSTKSRTRSYHCLERFTIHLMRTQQLCH